MSLKAMRIRAGNTRDYKKCALITITRYDSLRDRGVRTIKNVDV